MPRLEYCKSLLRHGFSEEVIFEGDLRMSWGVIREGCGERGPRRGNGRNCRSKGSEEGGCGAERVSSWRN